MINAPLQQILTNLITFKWLLASLLPMHGFNFQELYLSKPMLTSYFRLNL